MRFRKERSILNWGFVGFFGLGFFFKKLLPFIPVLLKVKIILDFQLACNWGGR